MQGINENLAIRAKMKDAAALLELYQRNQKFICRVCMKYAGARLTEDDIMQEAYFALLKAVEAFDKAAGYPFLAYFRHALQWHFARLWKADKNKRDLLILDRPIDDESPDTMMDMIEDEAAAFEDDLTDQLAKSEVYDIARSWLIHHAKAQGTAAPYYEILERHYRSGETYKAIAADMEKTQGQITDCARRALCILQRSPQLKEFEREYITASMARSSFTVWKETGTSSTEWAALKIADRKEREDATSDDL